MYACKYECVEILRYTNIIILSYFLSWKWENRMQYLNNIQYRYVHMICIYIYYSTSGSDTVRPFLCFSSVSCGLQGFVIFNPFTATLRKAKLQASVLDVIQQRLTTVFRNSSVDFAHHFGLPIKMESVDFFLIWKCSKEIRH